jgi:hypothetical protein
VCDQSPIASGGTAVPLSGLFDLLGSNRSGPDRNGARSWEKKEEIISMFQRVEYERLNARQKENYNFQKVAGRLADYGYNCLKLNDDWEGADFLAVHIDGDTVLKVQLKGRLVVDRRYCGKNIHIAFLVKDDCYAYPHDVILEAVLARGYISETTSWADEGKYTWPSLPLWAQGLLAEYKI